MLCYIVGGIVMDVKIMIIFLIYGILEQWTIDHSLNLIPQKFKIYTRQLAEEPSIAFVTTWGVFVTPRSVPQAYVGSPIAPSM